MRHLRLIPLAALSLLASACGPRYSPNVYNDAAMQQANKVEQGVIVGRRPVGVSADGTTGALAGGAAGGIAGSQTPGGAVSTAFGVLGGTLLGGLAGSAAEHAAGDMKAWEYIVREPKGELVSVTQADKVALEIGQKVLVITGKQARVVPDYTVAASPSDAPAQATPGAAPATPKAVSESPSVATKDTRANPPAAGPAATAPLAPGPVAMGPAKPAAALPADPLASPAPHPAPSSPAAPTAGIAAP